MATYSRRSFDITMRNMRNIEMLLRAAELLDKRDTDHCDHRYASSQSSVYVNRATSSRRPQQQRRKSSSKASLAWNRGLIGGRSLHNEMEKNRRANLRHCLERLRNVIPEGRSGESSKNTTLQLLKRAKQWILNLEQEQDKFEKVKSELTRQRAELNRMMSTVRPEVVTDEGSHGGSSGSSPFAEVLTYRADYQAYRQRVDSDSTVSSSLSSTELASEAGDDIDIMGTSSDTDEYGQ